MRSSLPLLCVTSSEQGPALPQSIHSRFLNFGEKSL
jgi:hypothetical protein